MEIRIGNEWVILSSKNNANIILAKIPEALRDSGEPIDPLKLHQKYYYSTIFGAIQGVFKYGLFDSEAKSFLELEAEIKRIAELCDLAFSKQQGGDV